jgi:quinol monooxygenase YgiN
MTGRRELILSFVAGAFALFLVQKVLLPGGISVRSASSGRTPFDLMVHLTFRDDDSKQTFTELFRPYCDYIEKEELSTLSYAYLQSDKDPLRGMIVERYVEKENAFLTIHRNTANFKEFRSKLQAMQDDKRVVIEGSSFVETDIGFM